MIKNILLGLAVFILVSCAPTVETKREDISYGAEASDEELLSILKTHNDYQELVDGFVNSVGREPDYVVVEKTRLTDGIIQQRITELGSDPYALLYKELDNNGNLYVFQIQDRTEKGRGMIATIDVQSQKVLKIFGTLTLSIG